MRECAVVDLDGRPYAETRGLIADSEKKLFEQFSADPNLKINEVDKEAFRAASWAARSGATRSPSPA